MDEIEALKQQLQQTQLAYRMSAQIGLFKTGFLGRIAHELRSPLSSLMSLHQLILSDLCENPQEERQFITQAYQSAQKLLKMIDEIVAVSKIDYGAIALEIESVQLIQLFRELEDITRLQAANRNLRLEIVLPEPEIYGKADFSRLLQALLLLVDTGIRHIESGKIKVTTVLPLEGDRVAIIVEIDCAIALWDEPITSNQTIASDNLAQIKELTQQVEMSPSLKLILVQTLLEAMGGSLEIEELSPENITQIRCWLPRISPEMSNQE